MHMVLMRYDLEYIVVKFMLWFGIVFSSLYERHNSNARSYLSLYGTLGSLTIVDMNCVVVLVILRCWELVPFSILFSRL